MINQGEEIRFSGTFEQKIGETWSTITNLNEYVIDALVLNETCNKKYIFSSKGTENKIIINGDSYSFNITPEQSASMVGECILEVSLKNIDGNPVITDNKGKFVINDSLLGRTLSKIK